MKKLFALEDDSSGSVEDNNISLIDKVIQRSKEPKSPLSLTADILKQRENLKKEISDKLKEVPEEDNTSSNIDKESSENEETAKEPAESSGNKKEDDKKSSEEDTDSSPKSSNEEDISEEAEDKEKLKSLIGSNLSSNPKEVSNESFNSSNRISSIFSPVLDSYKNYKVSLETYNLQEQANPINKQPIVYIKESVIESLNNLVKIANNYITANKTFIDVTSKSVKNINERITIFKGFIDNKKYHFTNKLINDKDILANISMPDKSEIRETIKTLFKYTEESNKAMSMFISNDFSTLESSFVNSEFIKEQEDLAYKYVLPGFNIVKVHLEPYSNYLKTPIQNYQYYKLKVFKTSDLFSLSSISINDDKELEFVVEYLDKLLVNITTNIDNLNDINTNFNKFTDEIKVITFDIEKDKYKNLSDIGIDEKVQEFIKFKLAIEVSYININLVIDYLSSIMSVLNSVLELKE